MRQLARAHRYLALLEGKSATIPNENILINTLSLQEAKESSAIENIVTTHDALYRAQLEDSVVDKATKEVSRYAAALKEGFRLVRQHKILTENHVHHIQQTLENNDAGYRRNPGTVLENAATHQVVYRPPQEYRIILGLMDNLFNYINNVPAHADELDPLIKMAIIHHRFETIHPYYDGNGRTGRIINVLYLVKEDLLTLPILYLSRYIVQTKSTYYHLLQQVRDEGEWGKWIMYILKGVEETAKYTLRLVERIQELMREYKEIIRSEMPNLYSQDLLNNLFKHPYTMIKYLQADLQIERQTAAKYLNTLASRGLLEKVKRGVSNYYINKPLVALFSDGTWPTDASEAIITINSIESKRFEQLS